MIHGLLAHRCKDHEPGIVSIRFNRNRRGAAFLLLVLMVLLVVVGTTHVLVRSEIVSRWGQNERIRERCLYNAMAAAVAALSERDGETIEFVIDKASDERIVIERRANRLDAQWLRGSQILDQMNRTLKILNEDRLEPKE